MALFQVVEMFTSINGEGPRAGELALFIRMRGCNLACAYCDTAWANRDNAKYEEFSTEEIVERVRRAGLRNVTVTGGEPLLQEGMEELLRALAEEPEVRVEIETNGSISLERYVDAFAAGVPSAASEAKCVGRPSFTMDYKLPGSGMEERMRPENFAVLTEQDTVKFVVTDRADLDRAREIIEEYHLTERCRVFVSPVYGAIDPEEIVEYMKEYHLNDVTLQLQLHKIIWGADRRAV